MCLMQLTESLLNPSILEMATFWIARLTILVSSMLFTKWLIFHHGRNWRMASWIKTLILFPCLSTVPMTGIEVLLEQYIPVVIDHDDADLREISPLLAFLGEYLTILSFVFSINLIIWLVLNRSTIDKTGNDKTANDKTTNDKTTTDSPPAVTSQVKQARQPSVQPTFMHKVPNKNYHDIIAIKAEGHYIRLYSDDDSTLIHHVFKQAIKELPQAEGSQVHRSWWVKHNAINKAKKNGKRFQLFLPNELTIPVSDSFVKQAKQQGILDKKY